MSGRLARSALEALLNASAPSTFAVEGRQVAVSGKKTGELHRLYRVDSEWSTRLRWSDDSVALKFRVLDTHGARTVPVQFEVRAGDAGRVLAVIDFEAAIRAAIDSRAPSADLVVQNTPLGDNSDKKVVPEIGARQSAQLRAAKAAGLSGMVGEAVASLELANSVWTPSPPAALCRLLTVLWIKAVAARKPQVVKTPLF